MGGLFSGVKSLYNSGVGYVENGVYAANNAEQSAISSVTTPISNVYHATLSAASTGKKYLEYILIVGVLILIGYLMMSAANFKRAFF